MTPSAASRRRRIRGDDPEALVASLKEERGRGPVTDGLREDLWLLGWDVLRGLVRTGRINAVHTGTPHPVLDPMDAALLHESAAVRDELVLDTLVATVDTFIERLREGAWLPERASIETYFVGAAARAWWDVYRRWRRARQREVEAVAGAARQQLIAPGSPSTSEALARREALKVIAGEANDEQLLVLARLLEDRSHVEIAAELQTTVAGVGARLYRLRKRAWEAVEDGRIDRTVLPSGRPRLPVSTRSRP